MQSKSSTFWLVSKEIQAERVPHAKISTAGEKIAVACYPRMLPAFPISDGIPWIPQKKFQFDKNAFA